MSIYHALRFNGEIHSPKQQRNMSWDPGLLRKYSATGHFRLLNQLRGDLKKKPLERDPATGVLRMPGSGRAQRSTRRFEQPRQDSYRPEVTRAESPQQASMDVAPLIEQPSAFVELAPLTDEQPKSFRDRLNAIEMR
tara:strand:+ start:1591 stop:2001 length:411 start_codon:yes stop_codon:yes gene_type:complete